MSLRVGIDAWNLPGDRRGVGRYVREIVRRWVAWGPSKIRPTLLIPEWPPVVAAQRYLDEIATQLPVRHRRAEHRMDVVWFPWNGLSWLATTPMVATLHDASLFRFPPSDDAVREREQRPFFAAAKHARRIITDSAFAKDELVHFLALDPHRIDVVHLGVNDVMRASSDRTASSPYVLFVGEAEPRKNLPALLEALALLPEQLGSTLELVIAGAKEYPLPQAPAGVRVRVHGWVSDEDLAQLYRRAAALVYPSSYEGFGLPIIEAMAAGTPVIAGDTQSSREVGGDAALYAAPSSARAIAAKIQEVLTQTGLAESLRQRGAARAKDWTWERTAIETARALDRALQPH
jgi:glycosyltransferase involved in cell wall biosynthesis